MCKRLPTPSPECRIINNKNIEGVNATIETIAVIGNPCAGKTTISSKLAELLDYDLIDSYRALESVDFSQCSGLILDNLICEESDVRLMAKKYQIDINFISN